MSVLLKKMLFPYMAPAGEDGADGGGGAAIVDRGDDFVPTEGPDAVDTNVVAPNVVEVVVKETPPDADPAAKIAEADPKKDSRIPLVRHEAILAKEREARAALETRLAQYEKGAQVAAINTSITGLENSVLAMDAAYAEHMAAGEIKQANEVMAKIRIAERQIGDAKTDMKTQASTAQATEQARYDTALTRVEAAYNTLNPDHDDFDKAVMGEVVEMKIFYERMRDMTPTAALQAAVTKILGSGTTAQVAATEVKPRVTAEEVAANRKKDAVGKALDSMSKTPPNPEKTGMDSDKAGGFSQKEILKMSQDDFKKLPDDVLSKLRGDDL